MKFNVVGNPVIHTELDFTILDNEINLKTHIVNINKFYNLQRGSE